MLLETGVGSATAEVYGLAYKYRGCDLGDIEVEGDTEAWRGEEVWY